MEGDASGAVVVGIPSYWLFLIEAKLKNHKTAVTTSRTTATTILTKKIS